MHEVFLQRPVTTRERERERERETGHALFAFILRPACVSRDPVAEWCRHGLKYHKNVSKVTFKLNTAGTFHDIRSYVILLKQSFRVIVFLIFKDYILYTSKVLAFSEVRQCMF